MIQKMAFDVSVRTTHNQHYLQDMKNQAATLQDNQKDKVSFMDFLEKSLGNVNQDQLQAGKLAERMVTNPEEVEVHDVMIALEKAKMSLNMARIIRDMAIKSYREITNLR